MIGWAQVMVMVAILGASFVWRWRSSEGRFWRLFLFWAEWVVLIIVAAGIFGRLWRPEFSGLTQRVTYLGFYLWLLVIVREIERRRLPAPEMNGTGEGNGLDKTGRKYTLLDETQNEIRATI